MQVRRSRIRILSRSHKTDNFPTLDLHSLPQPLSVAIQVRVVVAIHSPFIELVYCVATPDTEEQLADRSGHHRMHGCPSRLKNIYCLVPMSAVNFFEIIMQIDRGESADGRSHLKVGKGLATSKNHLQKRGNTNAEL